MLVNVRSKHSWPLFLYLKKECISYLHQYLSPSTVHFKLLQNQYCKSILENVQLTTIKSMGGQM